MANCNTCIKVNPIASCIDSEEFLLTGLTFPDNLTQTLTGQFINNATGRSLPFDITVDGSGVPTIDIAEFYPLPDHPHEIKFIDSSNVPARFLITNPDSTTSEGCCIEFETIPNLTGTDEAVISDQRCAV